MNSLYRKIGAKNFKYLTVVGCFMGDLAYFLLYYKIFSSFTHFNSIYPLLVETAKEMGAYDPQIYSEAFIKQLFQVIFQTVITVLGVVIIFHLVIYTLHLLHKRFAHLYLILLTWVAGFGTLWLGLEMVGKNWASLYFVFQALLYFFIAWGLHVYPNKTYNKLDSPEE